VKLHLLNLPSVIPAQTLRDIADELMPGARRQRLLQILSVVAGFVLVIGGNIVYFRYFSTWKGLDPINTTIYIVQFLCLMSGPLIAYRIARSGYASRVVSVMLKHRHCPHCGYDLRLLPVDPQDGATVCPECGCAWRLGEAAGLGHGGAVGDGAGQ
jgi:hypothetical protein